MDEFITLREAARILGVDRVQAWRIMNNHWMDTAKKLGGGRKEAGMWVVPKSTVMSYTPRKQRSKK